MGIRQALERLLSGVIRNVWSFGQGHAETRSNSLSLDEAQAFLAQYRQQEFRAQMMSASGQPDRLIEWFDDKGIVVAEAICSAPDEKWVILGNASFTGPEAHVLINTYRERVARRA